jgi:cell division protein FtsI/penicillin-binding protein 2
MFLGSMICLFALLIFVRLYYLQVMRNQDFLDQADRQYVSKGQSIFNRGTIFFSPRIGGPISAATLRSGYLVAINPKQVEHPEDVFNALSGIVKVDETNLLASLARVNDTYREIAHRIDEKAKDRIEALNFKGVNQYVERWRSYPGGKLASNVLGFVGYANDGTTLEGRYGLEKYYNDALSRSSSGIYVNFFAAIFSGVGDALFKDERSEGDIVTTIEPSVQAELESQIALTQKTWNSDLTGGIVMDPTTGEIYAMGVSSDFDPNDFSKVKDPGVFGNPIVDRVYEMGSIIKPLAMAAGLDTGAVTATTTYMDAGSVIVNGAKISNYDGKARGLSDMQKVLNQSLNVGMAFVTQKLGNQRLTDYFTALGFGKETGIDLPGEVHGLVSNLQSPRDIEHVTASFGQGIALTPIETIRALSALGNGGFLPEPHIVKRIEYTSGLNKTIAHDGSAQRIYKLETSEEITRMLVRVVDEALLGGTVKQPRYTIAAKTGTAQMALENGKGYYSDRYLHSFFGYFPAYKPRFIVFLYTVYPKGAEYASHTLTAPFIDMVKFLLNYYEVPPDR